MIRMDYSAADYKTFSSSRIVPSVPLNAIARIISHVDVVGERRGAMGGSTDRYF